MPSIIFLLKEENFHAKSSQNSIESLLENQEDNSPSTISYKDITAILNLETDLHPLVGSDNFFGAIKKKYEEKNENNEKNLSKKKNPKTVNGELDKN